MQEIEALGSKKAAQILAGSEPTSREWCNDVEYAELRARFEKGEFKVSTKDRTYMRMKTLEWSVDNLSRVADKVHKATAELMALANLSKHNKKQSRKFTDRMLAWVSTMHGLSTNHRAAVTLERDNLHLWQQKLLNWDRRMVEPLMADPSNFYPHNTSTLLDIQPKTADARLRELGPTSTRAADIFQVLLQLLGTTPSRSVRDVLRRSWAGAETGVLPHCPSLTDPARGGYPIMGDGLGDLSVRALSQEQLLEILQAWMDWPFRPEYIDMVGRMDVEQAEEPTKNHSTFI